MCTSVQSGEPHGAGGGHDTEASDGEGGASETVHYGQPYEFEPGDAGAEPSLAQALDDLVLLETPDTPVIAQAHRALEFRTEALALLGRLGAPAEDAAARESAGEL